MGDSTNRLVIGAMSGTSADGVDVALVRIRGTGEGMSAELVHHLARAFPAELKRTIFAVRSATSVSLRDLTALGRDVSLTYATAVNELLLATNLRAEQVTAVAAHGQTLFHEPPLTLQWLDPALLAERIRISVVSDFRRADCAVGGQGAPLVPFADFVLFRSDTYNRILLNIGGIANLAFLPAGGSMDDVIAFDTGPGNCVSDFLCRQAEPDGVGYDEHGTRAAKGHADKSLVDAVRSHAYFRKAPPKSTDIPTMIEIFQSARQSIGGAYWTDDLIASACMISVGTIVEAAKRFVGQPAHEWIVSGGGVQNRTMMELLGRAVPKIATADAFGIPAAAKEAVAFALLGAATLDGEPANLPSVTGAKRRVVLGAITPKP